VRGKQARGRWYHTCLPARACPRVRIDQSSSRTRWCCGECSAQACGLTASSVHVLTERSSSGTSTEEPSVSGISATGPAHSAGATSCEHRTGLRAGAWTSRHTRHSASLDAFQIHFRQSALTTIIRLAGFEGGRQFDTHACAHGHAGSSRLRRPAVCLPHVRTNRRWRQRRHPEIRRALPLVKV
jgi:hypothetical protein